MLRKAFMLAASTAVVVVVAVVSLLALGTIRRNSESALTAELLALMKQEGNEVRAVTKEAFERHGSRAVPAIIKAAALLDENLEQHLTAVGLQDTRPEVPQAVLVGYQGLGIASWHAVAGLSETETDVVPALLEAMKHDDPLVRCVSITALARSWPDPEKVKASLSSALRDKDDRVRRSAVLSFFYVIPFPKEIASVLVELFEDESQLVRAAAIAVLGDPGLELNVAAPDLAEIRSVFDDEGGFVLALSEALRHEPGCVPISCVEALRQCGFDTASVAVVLLGALTHENETVRWEAVHGLGTLGSDASDAVNPLVAVLKAPGSSLVRTEAAYALGEIRRHPEISIPALIEAAHDRDIRIRTVSYRALGRFEQNAEQVIPTLIHAMGDANPQSRFVAYEVYRKIGSEAELAVPLLIEELRRRTATSEIAKALSSFGENAQEAVPDLVRALYAENGQVNLEVALALYEVQPGRVDSISAISGALSSEDASVRARAAALLGRIGASAESAIPAMTELLHDEDVRVRQNILGALVRVGHNAGEAVAPAFIQALRDEDADIRCIAANAIGTYYSHYAQEAMPILVDLIQDENWRVRSIAADALKRVRRDFGAPLSSFTKDVDHPAPKRRWSAAVGMGQSVSEEPVPYLIDLLKDENAVVRWAAAEALETLAHRFAKGAIPALEAALQDPDMYVRYQAGWALYFIDGRPAPSRLE